MKFHFNPDLEHLYLYETRESSDGRLTEDEKKKADEQKLIQQEIQEIGQELE